MSQSGEQVGRQSGEGVVLQVELPEVQRSPEEVRWERGETVARELEGLESRQTVQSGVIHCGDDVPGDVEVLQLSQPSE